jgi:DNA-binding CsgD family transcriptional regulator/tetratricopeptide (TPR) repeat protein
VQSQLFEHVLGVLDRLGEHAPALVVFEDLHWADRSTLDLLVFLARNLRDARVVLVGTYRTDDLHRRHPLRAVLASLDRGGRVVRESLTAMNRVELRELIAAICDEEPDDDLVDRVLARSEGNPFFVEELLAAPEEGDGPLPESLRDVLLARIDALPATAQTVLRDASVIGQRVPHALLLAVTELSEADALEGVRVAVEHQVLLADESSYRFRHALLNEAVYDDLLPGERTRAHERVARAIEADPSSITDCCSDVDAELACHWFSAHDLPNTLAAAVRAAESAASMYAYPEALAHYERALEVWDRVDGAATLAGGSRAEVLRAAAASAELAGRQDRAAALIGRALSEVDEDSEPVEAALLHERLARYLWMNQRPIEELLPHNEAAVALVPAEPPSEARAVVLAALAQQLMLANRHTTAMHWCAQAIDAARAADAKAIEGHARNTLGTVLAHLGDLDAGLVELYAAQDLARATESWGDVARAAINLSGALEGDARYDEALEIARDGLVVIEAHGLSYGYGLMLRQHAIDVLFEMGRWTEAEEEMRSFDRVEVVGIDAFHIDNTRFTLRFHRSDLDGAQRVADAMRARALEAGIANRVSPYPQAVLAIARGNVAAADAILDEWQTRVNPDATPDDTPEWLMLELLRAHADLAPLDDAGRARVQHVRRELADLYERFGPARASVRARHPLPGWADAEVARAEGRHDPAQWHAVAESWAVDGRRPHLAYARFREAEAHLVAGDGAGAAQAPLREAHELAARVGIPWLVRDVEDLATRGRVDLGGESGAGGGRTCDPLALTPRELEVLERVAQGRTNRQIAEELFISVKTASVHVSNILTKLGAQNRGEAAAIARDRGLLPAVTSAR